jgi:hypothetical protein
MSNKPKFDYNKLKPSVKKLFDECKQKYNLEEKDIIPTGKQKNHPYIGKDIRLACSKKKPAKLDKKNKEKHSKTQKQKPIKGYKVELTLYDPYQSNSQNNSSGSYSSSKMNIKLFKTWCQDNIAKHVQELGFAMCNDVYKIKDDKTLNMIFYVNESKIEEAENAADALNNLDDDGYINVAFRKSKTIDTIITPIYEKIICKQKIKNSKSESLPKTKPKSESKQTLKKSLSKSQSSSKKIIGYNVQVKVTPELQDKDDYPILKNSKENMREFKKWLEQNVNYIPMRGFKMENIKIEILNTSDLKISYFVASDKFSEVEIIYQQLDELQEEPMELEHDGSIKFIPDPVGYKQSPKYLSGYGAEIDSVSSQYIPLQMINLKRNKTLLKKEEPVYSNQKTTGGKRKRSRKRSYK